MKKKSERQLAKERIYKQSIFAQISAPIEMMSFPRRQRETGAQFVKKADEAEAKD
jgi:hypothetical protein